MSRRRPDRPHRAVRRLAWLIAAGAVGYGVVRVRRGLRSRATAVTGRLLDRVGDLDGVTVTETITGAVAADGTVIVDDVTVAVDDRGVVVASDETIAVETPDGRVVTDEVVSVSDDQGNLVPVLEETSVEPSDDDIDAG